MADRPTYTIPVEHLFLGAVIHWNGESGSVESITDQPDDESFWVEILFDGAREDEGHTIPYGTEVRLAAEHIEASLARVEHRLVKLDETLAAVADAAWGEVA